MFSNYLTDKIRRALKRTGVYAVGDLDSNKVSGGRLRDRIVWAVCIVIHDQYSDIVVDGVPYQPRAYEDFKPNRLYQWACSRCDKKDLVWNARKIKAYLRLVSNDNKRLRTITNNIF